VHPPVIASSPRRVQLAVCLVYHHQALPMGPRVQALGALVTPRLTQYNAAPDVHLPLPCNTCASTHAHRPSLCAAWHQPGLVLNRFTPSSSEQQSNPLLHFLTPHVAPHVHLPNQLCSETMQARGWTLSMRQHKQPTISLLTADARTPRAAPPPLLHMWRPPEHAPVFSSSISAPQHHSVTDA
jgi:hypothetical protein